MNIAVQAGQTYSEEAHRTFDEIDRQSAGDFFAEIQAWRSWRVISDPATPSDRILSLVREIFRAVCWYQAHTTEAGFHMFGRLPKNEVRLMQALKNP